jgi:hypothetical protein
MMRTVLIALDGSPSSVQAARVGCGAAKARKARMDGLPSSTQSREMQRLPKPGRGPEWDH